MSLNKKTFITLIAAVAVTLTFVSCSEDETVTPPVTLPTNTATSSANYTDLVVFSGSTNSENGEVYEVLPGPSAINPAMDPTPFSNNIQSSTGTYEFTVVDNNPEDSESSTDAVTNVNIQFTGNDGRKYLIDNINIIHKAAGTGDHTFYGGVGLNKVMHGNTTIGTNLMPKMLAYITFWGLTDLKDAMTGEVVASNRVIHVMVSSKVRNDAFELITDTDVDKSDHDTWMAQTHIILPPLDMAGNMDPIPGTDHGFIHMMYDQVELTNQSRDWKKVYEILPGPAAMNPAMNPTPFSNKVAFGSGSFTLTTSDKTEGDSESSEDVVDNILVKYQRPDGTMFMVDNVQIIHKAAETGDHPFFGGVGFNKEMHGNTTIGTNLMPKMLSYITLWGKADLKDGNGTVIASDRLVHIMVSSRTRTQDLQLLTDADNDVTDRSPSQVQTHIIFAPLDMNGNMDPVPGTGHGFLHLMFENVDLSLN
jgi:hypothetical protein